ncbi:SDR family oxidoreductase [Devosia sp. XJ19-1]|uniref:SDR family oxidoreductase n=1 Tax=Devosia ureilytica TaxID=2952754 RepID=A0A9Q4FRC3_9HYPH|nr:SDR family oxidoreductase [Devosia ureilytica]MCP8882042.1 SDR family oxidoreductase [Devosia ureilytica]MCP8886072.1 SDR family oxidoreductase [Devosia ureilytica]
MTKFANSTLLVTGASGQLGRIAVEELLARGATKVIAGTRDPSRLADFAARGVEVRKLDFNDAATFESGFAGVERVLIISTSEIGRRIAQQTAAVAAAKAAGVRHIVYTSAPAARPDADAGLGPEHFWTESAIFASGLDFTILRNHMYAENTLMDAAPTIASGQLYGLVGDRGTSYVTRADTARTAAGALLSAQGQTIEDVTGPAPVTNVERAALLSELSGKPVAVVPLPPADLEAGMVSAGLPDAFAKVLVAFQRDAVAGYHGVVTDVVERYSGRKPETLADMFNANRAAILS